jgi:hypothetical protein
MLDIERQQLTRILKALKALSCKYAILDSDGTLHGAVEDVTPKPAKQKRHCHGSELGLPRHPHGYWDADLEETLPLLDLSKDGLGAVRVPARAKGNAREAHLFRLALQRMVVAKGFEVTTKVSMPDADKIELLWVKK